MTDTANQPPIDGAAIRTWITARLRNPLRVLAAAVSGHELGVTLIALGIGAFLDDLMPRAEAERLIAGLIADAYATPPQPPAS